MVSNLFSALEMLLPAMLLQHAHTREKQLSAWIHCIVQWLVYTICQWKDGWGKVDHKMVKNQKLQVDLLSLHTQTTQGECPTLTCTYNGALKNVIRRKTEEEGRKGAVLEGERAEQIGWKCDGKKGTEAD